MKGVKGSSPYMKIAGVYMMASRYGKCYIGASLDCLTRWRVHKRDLRFGVHPYQAIFSSSLKAGKLSFVLLKAYPCVSTMEELWPYEQKWAEKFPYRVNIRRNATGKGDVGPNAGKKYPKQWVDRMVAGRAGYKHSEAVKIKISEALMGRKRPAEFCRKMSLATKAVWERRRNKTNP